MSRRLLPLLAGSLMLAGCSTLSGMLDSINPFSGSGPKLAPLPGIANPAEVRVSWSLGAGKAAGYVFSPAVAGDAVFVAANDGTVQRIEDGKTVWKIDAGQKLSAGVGADERVVVVGTPKGEVLAFAAADGKPLWQAQVSSEVLASPVVDGGNVAVKSGDNRVFLFDAGDGSRKWVYQRSTPPLSVRGAGTPVFSGNYLFVGFPGGKVAALTLQNGAPAWEGTVALPRGATELDRVADVVAAPVIDGTQICAVAFQGRVACFDLGQGGTLVWSRDISSAAGLALDGRYLFVTDEKGIVQALDRYSGSSMWKQDKLVNRRVSAPTVRRGNVLVADGLGYVHVLAREDGSFVGRLKTDGSPVTTPVLPLASGFVVQTSGGEINAFEVQ